MTSLRTAVERWVDTTLDSMLKRPRMYGSTESVELQALLLLDLRAFIAHPEAEEKTPGRVFEAWLAAFGRRYPQVGASLPSGALQTLHAHDEAAQFRALTEALDEFRRALVAELAPDNPFAQHDLALAVRMQKGKRLPPASRIGAFYSLVGQVMRSVVRRGGTRGKLPREYEEAIAVFPAGGFEIVPENGIGAQIVMPFDWPQGAQTSLPSVPSPEVVVRDAFGRFVSVAAWASDDEPMQRLVQAVADAPTRTRMALDAMRLLPPMGGDIEAVEIGGRSIHRELPVSLRPQARERLLDVVAYEQKAEPFDAVGTLRMVDLDEGRLRLRAVDAAGRGGSVEVWLTGTEMTAQAATPLGGEVRVTGQRFVRATGRPFVVAKTLQGRDDDEGVDEGN